MELLVRVGKQTSFGYAAQIGDVYSVGKECCSQSGCDRQKQVAPLHSRPNLISLKLRHGLSRGTILQEYA